MRQLLGKGCKPCEMSHEGKSAWDYAIQEQKTAVVAVIDSRLSAYKINGCLEITVLAGIAFRELSYAEKKTSRGFAQFR